MKEKYKWKFFNNTITSSKVSAISFVNPLAETSTSKSSSLLQYSRKKEKKLCIILLVRLISSLI